MPSRANTLRIILATVAIVAVGSTLAVYVLSARMSRLNTTIYQQRRIADGIEAALSHVKDAETGQRGYLLTGDDSYLQPYTTALDQINKDERQLSDWEKSGDLPRQEGDVFVA